MIFVRDEKRIHISDKYRGSDISGLYYDMREECEYHKFDMPVERIHPTLVKVDEGWDVSDLFKCRVSIIQGDKFYQNIRIIGDIIDEYLLIIGEHILPLSQTNHGFTFELNQECDQYYIVSERFGVFYSGEFSQVIGNKLNPEEKHPSITIPMHNYIEGASSGWSKIPKGMNREDMLAYINL